MESLRINCQLFYTTPLSSGAIIGVKQRTAEAIYRQFGLQTLYVIEKSPEKLLSVRGISERKLREIVESYGQNQVFRELMTFLAPYKVTPKKVNMILKTFYEESVRIPSDFIENEGRFYTKNSTFIFSRSRSAIGVNT